CVLTPEIGVLSETFVAWDVNELSPGGTVVVADPPPRGASVVSRPAWSTDAPALSFEPAPGDPPPSEQRRRDVAEFLHAHGVETVLIEFADFAERWFDMLAALGLSVWIRAHGADVSARLRESYRRFNSAYGVTVPSRALATKLRGVGIDDDKIHVVPNHVAVPTQKPARRADHRHVRCISIGRMVPKKGHLHLLAAFEQAVSADPRLRLDIIGDGPLRPEIEREIQRADLAHRVQLCGALTPEATRRTLAAADVFVHHAVTGADGDAEGQPLTILEAMAAGLPLVLTRHSGIPEIAQDGEHAIFTDERDTEATAHALVTLAADSDMRHTMGVATWEHARTKHDHDVVRPHLLRLLEIGEHR
ncbi:MAG: glycosyltransferase, partial [Pseudonocardiaceae bacterium]